MLKGILAMLVVCTVAISMKVSAGTTWTNYCALLRGATWDYSEVYDKGSCGTNCYTYMFYELLADNIDGIECQIQSDTEYYSFEWRYSLNNGSTWVYGGNDSDCGWELGYYVCTAHNTSAYDDWSWYEPANIVRFQYKYSSGGSTYTRFCGISKIEK